MGNPPLFVGSLWSLGSVSCPVCSYLFPLTTNRNGGTVTCAHCFTVCAPNPVSDEATTRFVLPQSNEGPAAHAEATTDVKDNRVQEEAFCERCNTFRQCYSFAQQTRSADEGQTIFYTCTVCNSEWSSNS